MAENTLKKILPSMKKKRYETKEIAKYRKALLSNVTGEILELGIGKGENLQYYPDSVRHITAVDSQMEKLCREMPVTDHYYSQYNELPFEENSFDTIVTTFTLGDIIDTRPVFAEIKRVLRPRGRLLFLESGRALEHKNMMFQDIVNPLFEVFAGRVINRDYFAVLKEEKFLIANQKKLEAGVAQKQIYGTLYTGIALNVK